MAKNIRVAPSSVSGDVPGPYHEESMVCQLALASDSIGSIWLGYNPFAYTTPVMFAQCSLFFFASRTIFFFLKPLKQSLMSAQIIAGIILGPSFLGRDINSTYSKDILPPGGRSIVNAAAEIGFMIHLFLLGVQIDFTMLRKAGRDSVLIGTTGFAFAVVLSGLAMLALPHMLSVDGELTKALPLVATVNSITSFPVITSLLADLNILNSEIGRLATYSSLVGDFWSYYVASMLIKIGDTLRSSNLTLLWSAVWVALYPMLIFLVLRPLMLLIAKTIPEGGPMKESHFMTVMLLVLGCGLSAEIVGLHSALGCFLCGMVVPEGPPLGEALMYKLDAISSGLFLPIKLVITGLEMELNAIKRDSAARVIELVILCGYLGKFLGTLATALYSSLPLWDAISLALVMCCKGVVDIAIYSSLKNQGIIGNQEYALLIMTMLIVTGVARALVWYLYDPSRRYMAHKRTNLQDSRRHNVHLRMLICIHNAENVPNIINLLEASNPTTHSPISVFVLNLNELKGRATAVLETDFRRGQLSNSSTHSKPIVNAFAYYAEANYDRIFLQHFTAIAPYSSMHDDICMLAMEKNIAIVIVPFHKQWAIDGSVGAIFPSIRTVNQNVMEKAPCSVGVLVDRSHVTGSCSLFSDQHFFRIALLFLGGPDDREALAYGSRMADNPHVALTVAWIRPWAAHGMLTTTKTTEDDLDVELMKEFRASSMGKERIVFKEETVEDAEGTTRVIRSLEDNFDLFIVGRHHEASLPQTSGLTEWCHGCPELGVIGDMLASSNFRYSVLVVQQQARGVSSLDTGLNRRIGTSNDNFGSEVHRDYSGTEEYKLKPIRSEYKE